jgi:hypothetical protein
VRVGVGAGLLANCDKAAIQAAEDDDRPEAMRGSAPDARFWQYLDPQLTRIGARAKLSVQQFRRFSLSHLTFFGISLNIEI